MRSKISGIEKSKSSAPKTTGRKMIGQRVGRKIKRGKTPITRDFIANEIP
jgi:hypothetical protein